MRNYVVGIAYLTLRWCAKLPSHTIRNFLLRFVYGVKLSKGACLYGGFIIRNPTGITIESGTVIGGNCELDGRMGLWIGKNVNISGDVQIFTLQHDYRDPHFKTIGGPVEIHDYAWLSARSMVLPGVKIGKGAIVAAGAVVTQDVQPYTVVAGVPAKEISKRPKDLDYTPADYVLPFR